MQRALLAVPCLLAMAGCGTGQDEAAKPAAPTVTVTASPSESESSTEAARGESVHESVEDLRDAAIDAGYECRRWKQDNQVALATESGSCSGADVFALFASAEDRDAQLEQQADFAADYGFEMEPMVVGGNWTINSPDAAGFLSIALGADLQ